MSATRAIHTPFEYGPWERIELSTSVAPGQQPAVVQASRAVEETVHEIMSATGPDATRQVRAGLAKLRQLFSELPKTSVIESTNRNGDPEMFVTRDPATDVTLSRGVEQPPDTRRLIWSKAEGTVVRAPDEDAPDSVNLSEFPDYADRAEAERLAGHGRWHKAAFPYLYAPGAAARRVRRTRDASGGPAA